MFRALAAALLLAASPVLAACPKPKAGPPLRMLIVSGGHDYEPVEVFAAFDAMRGVTYRHVFTRGTGKPNAYPLGGIGSGYDVVLFYDMEPGAMTPEWRDLLTRGRGLVFLHHAIGSFPAGKDLAPIMGGQANFKDVRPEGVVKSTYQHNVRQRFTITDPAHPVTCGTGDFSLIDEGYDRFTVEPGAKVVMTSDFSKESRAAAWEWNFGGRRAFYLQPGHGSLGLPEDHGPTPFQDANFKRLLERAILWAAGRL